MKLYVVKGKGDFEDITSLVLESSKIRACKLVAETAGCITSDDLEATIIKFGNDVCGIILVTIDNRSSEFYYHPKIDEA